MKDTAPDLGEYEGSIPLNVVVEILVARLALNHNERRQGTIPRSKRENAQWRNPQCIPQCILWSASSWVAPVTGK